MTNKITISRYFNNETIENDTYTITETPLRCADYFTKYRDVNVQYNHLKINGCKSIKKEYPKIYYILNKLHANFINKTTIKDDKYKLVFYFRILRYINPIYSELVDLIYKISSTTTIGIFQALYIAELIYIKKGYTKPFLILRGFKFKCNLETRINYNVLSHKYYFKKFNSGFKYCVNTDDSLYIKYYDSNYKKLNTSLILKLASKDKYWDIIKYLRKQYS